MDHAACAFALWRAAVRSEALEAALVEARQELEQLKQEQAPKGPRAVERPEEPA